MTINGKLAYTNGLSSSDTFCTKDVTGVLLTNGVFHVKFDFACKISGANVTLTQFLSQTPAGESVAIKITDVTHSRPYSFQALHALPFANVASQLVQNGAGDGEFLKWSDSAKGWVPGTVSGASGGTVTSVSVSAPLSISTPTSTPSITLPQASGSQSGYLSSADWTTFNSKEGTIAGGTATQYYRGDKSWRTLDTAAVTENVANLYFTNARVLGVPLAGFAVGSGAITSADTTLSAFEKAQGQINTLTNDSSHFLKKDSADTLSGNTALTGVITADPVLGDIVVRSTPMGMTSAVNKSYVDSADGLKVNKAGDTMSGALSLDNDLKIKGGANYVTVKAHASSNTYDFTLPQTAGTNGYVLQTDGSGNLSWINPSSVSAGAGTVNSASIINGSIVDIDINASAAIAQSKIANLTTDLAGKVSTTLSSGNILVGSAGNVATAVAVSGDATLSNTGALTLVNTGTAGTYKSVTVDAKGRVTAGTNPTTLAGYGITDTLVTGVSVTAPITNTGTPTVPVIGMPVATGSANGYLSSADYTVFNNKQDAITSASTISTGSLTTNLQGGLILNPYNTGAGNSGEIRFKELVAGGSEYTGFKAPDSIATNLIYTLPSANGSSGQVLTNNGSGVLSWTTVATSSSSLTGDIGGTIGANTIGAGKVTLTHLSATGTPSATTYLKGDNTWATFAADVRTSVLTGLSTSTNAVITAADSVLSSLGKLQKQISDMAVSAVSGDLSGNLPNPTVVKIQGKTISSSAPSPGHVLRFNAGGTSWDPSFLLIGDLKSSVAGNLFPGSGCALNQTLQYSAVGDVFTCVNIDSLDAGKITTGTIAAARLPSSATYWQAATGGINYAGGNVGVGTASPTSNLHVAINETGGLRIHDTQATGSAITIGEGSSTANLFHPTYLSTAVGSNRYNQFIGESKVADDTGSTPVTVFVSRRDDSSSIVNRPLFDWKNANTSLMTMSASGNVGIGTVNPLSHLHVQSSSGAETRITGDGDLDTPSLYILEAPTIGNESGFQLKFDGTNGVSGNRLDFISHSPGVANPRLSILRDSGNVGIGTTSPTEKLHIENSSGSAALVIKGTTTSVSTRAEIKLDRTDSPRGAGMRIMDSGTALAQWWAGVPYNGGGTSDLFTIGRHSSQPEYLANSFLTINSTGNVGIGTTSPTQKLSIQGTSVSGGTEQTNISAYSGSGMHLAGSISNASQDAITYASGGGGGAAIAFRRGGSYDTYLDFYTNSAATAGAITQAMTINNGGSVGIGTSSPIARLEVNGTFSTKGGEIIMQRPTVGGGWARGLHFTPDGSTNATAQGLAGIGLLGSGTTQSSIYLTFGTAPWTSTTGIQILANGNVGLGTVSPSYKLDVQGGGVNATGGFTSVSDIRLKTNIEYLKSNEALKKITSLNGIYYDWKDQEKLGSDHQIGLIAQQVQKVFPEATKTNKDGLISVAYSNLISPVIESIKELYLKITGIEAKQSIQARQIASLNTQKADDSRVKKLELENSKLKQENAAIKAYLCKKDPSATICK